MGKRNKHMPGSIRQPPGASADPPVSGTAPRLRGRRLTLYRLLAALIAPALLLLLLELGLRLAGFGHPAVFFLPASRDGQDGLVQNNRFGLRFFGPDLARWPCAFFIPREKPPDTVRIFVLGESAARGEPRVRLGLPSMLQALLSLRHPDVRFEVVNTAMTAINSHAILPIARDCARAQGDLWVIYMGNNEVVGPFGAGTVFGSQSPPLPLIRATLALKATRTGQGLERLSHWLGRPAAGDTEWGGMKMFLDQQVSADDPRLQGVYHHFERNLSDILQAGRRQGVGMVLSTVAVNLRDCAPFASAHRPGLSPTDKDRWDQFYAQGVAAQEAGDARRAAEQYREAARLDDRHAELRYRQGECALTLGQGAAAREEFATARDLDTLRFRCDRRLNELVRAAAAGREAERVLLADAERVFAEQSPNGLPGEEWFYEHVHLRFAGNYLLARAIAAQVEKLLPEKVAAREATDQPWPSADDCARRLARSDVDEALALRSILTVLSEAPFTGQRHHEMQVDRLEALLERMTPAMQPAGVSDAVSQCEAALAVAPDDPALLAHLAVLKKNGGDLAGAAAAARRELELVPEDSEGWSLLGSILARQQQVAEAAAAYRRAFELGPQGLPSSLELAGALATLGQQDEAIAEYRHVLARKPGCVPALLRLGRVLEGAGNKVEAEELYKQALAGRGRQLPELQELGSFCLNSRRYTEALDIYQEALQLNPSDARLQVDAGRSLVLLDRYEEAARHFAEAARLAPRLAAARFNLGVTLVKLGRGAEALAQFEAVLERSPTNALAAQYIRELRAKAGSGPGP